MTAGYQTLNLVPGRQIIPLQHAQELLQRPGRYAGRIRDRLHALAIQIA